MPCARAAPAGKGGAVVNIASVAATIAFPSIAVYSGTKSAVDRMTRVGAMEAGKLGYGVRVNCIYPGLIPTDMGMKLANDIVKVGLAADVNAAVGSVVEQTPLGRLAEVTRHRRRRGLPVLERGALHHRHRPAGRWRHGHVATSRQQAFRRIAMSEKKPVIVYGASGYTGRLVCEYLREYNIPFIAAGRSEEKLDAAMKSNVAGIETADYEVVEVPHTVGALTELFKGASVVLNTVGPFAKFGGEVVQACLASKCHYTDTTGEQDWLITLEQEWGAKFADAGLLLSPGIAQMYTTGEIAAQLCLETPGLDTLDIAVFWGGSPTIASTQTILVNAAMAKAYYLEQNKYVEYQPDAGLYSLAIPGQHELALALPWGGTSHPVWFKRDPRVANVRCWAACSTSR